MTALNFDWIINMSDKNKYASSSLADLAETPFSKLLREQQNRAQAFNVESTLALVETPFSKYLREQQNRAQAFNVESPLADLVETLLGKYLREQQSRGQAFNIESSLADLVESSFSKYLREQQNRVLAFNVKSPAIKTFRELQEILNRAVNFESTAFKEPQGISEALVDNCPIFLSLNGIIADETLEQRYKPNKIAHEIVAFLDSEGSHPKESLSDRSPDSWQQTVLILYCLIFVFMISCMNVDTNAQQVDQEIPDKLVERIVQIVEQNNVVSSKIGVNSEIEASGTDNPISSQTIGQRILAQLKETGYLGGFSDVPDLSENYKEYLDWSDKV